MLPGLTFDNTEEPIVKNVTYFVGNDQEELVTLKQLVILLYNKK